MALLFQSFRLLSLLTLAILLGASQHASASSKPAARGGDTAKFKGWIEDFKTAPKGPFESIRLFSKDGTVLPPKAYACRPHGGGIQHGALNSRAREIRSQGYAIANCLNLKESNM